MAKDAGGEYYYMVAGGADTKPSTTNPSQHSIKREEKKPGYAAIKIKSAKASAAADGKVAVSWEIDAQALPQFSFTLAAYQGAGDKAKPLAELQKIEPHARTAELALPAGTDRQQVHLLLRCVDILGNQSALLPVELQQN